MEEKHWVKGTCLVVKPGVTHWVTERDMGGWQGRLMSWSLKKEELTIEWDSLTLLALAKADILRCEAFLTHWSSVFVMAQDVLPATPRDSEQDVRATLAALEKQYCWLSLGAQGRRIRRIVNQDERHDWFTSSRIWYAYLQEHLVFPFEALVDEAQRGPVSQGDQVKVTGMSILDDTVGTVVRVRLKRRVYHLPLRELESLNAPAKVEQLIKDYRVWFARYPHIYTRISY